MSSPEFKKLMGHRESDSDGFTYSYGRFKGSHRGAKNKDRVAVLVRHDKRSVKAASLKRELKDSDYV